MPAVSLTPDDLSAFAEIEYEKAAAMIQDALALAARVAPCITSPDFAYPDAAKAILRQAILRWNESGSGATTTQTAGPFSQTVTPSPRRSLFWPSEISGLSDLCSAGTGSSRAFSIDTMPAGGGAGPVADDAMWQPWYTSGGW